MDDLLREFLTETAENLAVLDAELVQFEHNPHDGGILGNIFRLVHTIKGTCGFLGLSRLRGSRTPARTCSASSATATSPSPLRRSPPS